MPSRARRPFPRAFHRLLTFAILVGDGTKIALATDRGVASEASARARDRRHGGERVRHTQAPRSPALFDIVRATVTDFQIGATICGTLNQPARASAAANRHGRRTLRCIATPIARTPNPTSGSKSEPPGGRDAYTLRRRPRAGLRDGPRQLVTPVSCVDRPKRVIVYMHGQLPALLVSALDRSAVHFAWCRDRFARHHQRADLLAGAQPSRLADRRMGRRARDLRRKSYRSGPARGRRGAACIGVQRARIDEACERPLAHCR